MPYKSCLCTFLPCHILLFFKLVELFRHYLKALYQHIADEIETMTFSDVFCIWTSVYVLCVLWFCDIEITPLTRAWPAGVALCPQLGERASKIDITRILSSAEALVCFSFRYLVFIFVLTCHHKVCKARSNDSCGRGRYHAANDTACACACLMSRCAVDLKYFWK